MSEAITVALSRDEAVHLSHFLEDQKRAARRIRYLEDTAQEMRVDGQDIPATAAERTASFLRWRLVAGEVSVEI